jgi:hypothetical protein
MAIPVESRNTTAPERPGVVRRALDLVGANAAEAKPYVKLAAAALPLAAVLFSSNMLTPLPSSGDKRKEQSASDQDSFASSADLRGDKDGAKRHRRKAARLRGKPDPDGLYYVPNPWKFV